MTERGSRLDVERSWWLRGFGGRVSDVMKNHTGLRRRYTLVKIFVGERPFPGMSTSHPGSICKMMCDGWDEIGRFI